MTEHDLERVARSAGGDLEGAPAEQVLRWAVTTFGGRFCVTSSMADAILIHLAATVQPGVDVLFIDTGYHFAETLGTRDAIAASYPAGVVNVTPAQTVAEQDSTYGPRLYAGDPDRCCALRKVAPLDRALEPYLAWGSGVRRSETKARRDVRVVDWDERRGKVKVNPLARWNDSDAEAYAAANDILVNPLRSVGYLSIGCAPCTRRVEPGEDPRDGRWAGFGKTECGIHR